MSIIPQWIIGKNVVTTIYPLTVASDGTITPGSSTALAGVMDRVGWGLNNTVENIVPTDVRQDNEVIIGTGQEITLTEILNAGAILASAGFTGDYLKVTFARAGKTCTLIGVIKGYTEDVVRGKSTGVMTLGPAGIAATYA